MSKDQQKEINSMILDYQLWVATMEQFMEDNQLTFHQIYQQLQGIKQQLNKITRIKSIQSLTEQIIWVDDSLKNIQLQVNQFRFQTI